MTTDPTRLVRIGKLIRAHGLKGEVSIKPDVEESETLLELDAIVLREKSGQQAVFEIESIRTQTGGFLVRLKGIAGRTEAEKLGGREVLIRREQLPDTEPDEYYSADLVGLEAVTPDGRSLGRVERVSEIGGAVPVLEIRGASELQVPLVETFVKDIDLAAGRIEIDPPVAGEEDEAKGEKG